jgi:hypothetical protein
MDHDVESLSLNIWIIGESYIFYQYKTTPNNLFPPKVFVEAQGPKP